ncbi:MAG: ATP synthase subunit I [Acidimicrobiales bacterium]
MSTTPATRLHPDTPPVERQIALDMAKRAVPLAPVLIAVSALIWGADGAWSSLVAVAIVLLNLIGAALAMTWAAKRSLAALMAVALGGFVARMAVVVAIVALIRDEPWVDLVALGANILVTQLGLLVLELRYVSASLAFPGLKPAAPKEAPSS